MTRTYVRTDGHTLFQHVDLTAPNVAAGKKEQASRCCTADVCLCMSVNQLCNNNKMAKPFFFPLLGNGAFNIGAPLKTQDV